MLSNNAMLVYGILSIAGPHSTAQLVERTRLSQPVISRALAELRQSGYDLISHQSGRSIIYALGIAIRDLPIRIPIHTVSEHPLDESVSLFGHLISLSGEAGGFYFIPAGSNYGLLFNGLPWFLCDMRPQGYIGRAFCHTHATELGLSENLNEWSDADAMYAISRFGQDTPGNLLVGHASLREHNTSITSEMRRFEASSGIEDGIGAYFDQLAEMAVQGGVAGSSAAGEHPKFLARYETLLNGDVPDNVEVRNSIVKFSPRLDGSPAATRWKDLLVAEHVASDVLGAHGVDVPNTRIILTEQRCYLESLRYDRVGRHGRVGVVSFEAIDDEYIGERRRWSQSANRLQQSGMLEPVCEDQILLIEQFGRLIGNTDMHFGNLSFFWRLSGEIVRLTLAPIYDMLPMVYAPEKSEVVDRSFSMPTVIEHTNAAIMAEQFWRHVSEHDRISGEFRQIAREHSEFLARLLRNSGIISDA